MNYKQLCIALLLFVLQGCAIEYSAEPITAHLVDAETEQPLEGVIVVARWELEGGLEGGNFEGNVMVLETVTDATGTFHFPAWGPIKTTINQFSNARLKSHDPEMMLFKSGYELSFLRNSPTKTRLNGAGGLRSSDWNGKAIRMQRFKGTLGAYAIDVADNFPRRAFEHDCSWRNTPLMLKALGEQARIFRAANIRTSTFYDDLLLNDGYQSSKGCGSVAEFLREHNQ